MAASPSAVLEPKKIKSVTVSIFSPIYLPWSDGTRCQDLSFLNVVLSQRFQSPLSPSSRGSLVPLQFLLLKYYHLHIWGSWYFSWQSWFQLVIYGAWHFTSPIIHSQLFLSFSLILPFKINAKLNFPTILCIALGTWTCWRNATSLSSTTYSRIRHPPFFQMTPVFSSFHELSKASHNQSFEATTFLSIHWENCFIFHKLPSCSFSSYLHPSSYTSCCPVLWEMSCVYSLQNQFLCLYTRPYNSPPVSGNWCYSFPISCYIISCLLCWIIPITIILAYRLF